jgi:hypothetical protein
MIITTGIVFLIVLYFSVIKPFIKEIRKLEERIIVLESKVGYLKRALGYDKQTMEKEIARFDIVNWEKDIEDKVVFK